MLGWFSSQVCTLCLVRVRLSWRAILASLMVTESGFLASLVAIMVILLASLAILTRFLPNSDYYYSYVNTLML